MKCICMCEEHEEYSEVKSIKFEPLQYDIIKDDVLHFTAMISNILGDSIMLHTITEKGPIDIYIDKRLIVPISVKKDGIHNIWQTRLPVWWYYSRVSR